MDTINYDDFKKIDLRVAKILKAERVEGSDKLIKLQISLGDPPPSEGADGGGQRQLVAGIGTVYTPEILIGKQIIIVANLEPRTFTLRLSSGQVVLESQGMLLAASDELGPVLLCPESEVEPGTGIR